MTETRLPADKPSPADALEALFRTILRRQMHDMPMVNAALSVEAVGFRAWRDHWLGILVTPWFMNLMLMPRVAAQWLPLAERETRHYVFPAGVFEFIGARDALLGDYQACSLFSPMFEFSDPAQARTTAMAALDALFDPENCECPQADDIRRPPREGPPPPIHAFNKRDFLLMSKCGSATLLIPPRGADDLVVGLGVLSRQARAERGP